MSKAGTILQQRGNITPESEKFTVEKWSYFPGMDKMTKTKEDQIKINFQLRFTNVNSKIILEISNLSRFLVQTAKFPYKYDRILPIDRILISFRVTKVVQ